MSSRFVARSLQVAVDLVVLCAAYALAFLFRFEFDLNLQQTKLLFFTLPYVALLEYVALALVGVPALAWRYVGLRDTSRIAVGIGAAVAILVTLRLVLPTFGGHTRYATIPLGILATNSVLSFLGVAGVRVLRRVLGERTDRRRVERVLQPKRTLLIGAGADGSQVAREINGHPDLGMVVVGFADDNPVKIGTVIQGARVLGDTYSLSKLAQRHKVEQLIITMSAVSSEVIRRLVRAGEEARIPTKIIPGLHEILDGRVNLSRIREVTIEDLLGRDAVDLDIEALRHFVSDRRVLVTGAGGSIGSELCRQLAYLNPERLVLVERAENALFEIHRELTRISSDTNTVPCICDVCDDERLDSVFREHRPDIVFHAAAHKHVPMMEWNPGEAIKNNVFGTQRLVDAADRHEVSAFVMISTDKAVNPTSVMGATKRAAELYVQAMSQRSGTKFVAVRFGNVLGSTGSVIPTFQDQIRRGGPVTVTHPDMTRYFMTIPEASQLVLQAAAMGKGGEIFVLDMGQPVAIVQLARDLIRLSGLSETEIPIEFTGVRPGEKLYEELGMGAENLAKTRHPKIFIGKIATQPWDKLRDHLGKLDALSQSSPRLAQLRGALQKLLPEMREPDCNRGPETGPDGTDSAEQPEHDEQAQPRLLH